MGYGQANTIASVLERRTAKNLICLWSEHYVRYWHLAFMKFLHNFSSLIRILCECKGHSSTNLFAHRRVFENKLLSNETTNLLSLCVANQRGRMCLALCTSLPWVLSFLNRPIWKVSIEVVLFETKFIEVLLFQTKSNLKFYRHHPLKG